jgi:hypothetical protein
MCTATDSLAHVCTQSPLELVGVPTLAHQLLERGRDLPIEHVAQIALMQIAAKRLLSLHNEAIEHRSPPGMPGWTQIADGWCIKVTEHDDGVWLFLRGPWHDNDHPGIGFRKPTTSMEANDLRKLRRALQELM